MEVKQLAMGILHTNCYLVIDEATQEALLVDPAGPDEQLAELLAGFDGKVNYIVATHGHLDHVGSLAKAKELTGAPILIHASDAPMLEKADESIASYLRFAGHLPPPDRLLQGGEELRVGETTFQVIHTPGHTPGCICLLGGGLLLSGDTLFAGSIGRYDLPGGDFATLMKSLRKLKTLPEETRVLPGHSAGTTIAQELRSNRFLSQS